MADTAELTRNVKPETKSKFGWFVSDSLVLIERSIKHITKNPDQLLSVAFQPIMFMLLFRYVFGGAIATGGTSYVNYLVAGILVQTAAFGSTYTAIGVSTDLHRGIIDRFKSLPMNSSAVLIGHTVADLVRNTVSSIIMILVGLAVGFRPTATFVEWLMVIGILLLFTFAFSWLSAILGLFAKSIEAVQWISFVFIFPLTFASSAYVPTKDMPTPLRIFAENQPVTQVIEAIRALLVGTPMGHHALYAVLWSLGILIISIPFATYLFRRHSTR
ncbi:MAG: ABC transporter permease [Patescibacteria group bacterium]|jgi:ABC-2 type transport system permease protein|nr:ABC transporter permease [Patescibacteria group bacterium]